jgi:hypothetical protein
VNGLIYIGQANGHLQALDIKTLELSHLDTYSHGDIWDFHIFNSTHKLLCCFQGLVEVKNNKSIIYSQSPFLSLMSRSNSSFLVAKKD